MADATLQDVVKELFGSSTQEAVKLSNLVRKIPRPRVYQPINGECFPHSFKLRISFLTNICESSHNVRLIDCDTGMVVATYTVIPACLSGSTGDGSGSVDITLPTLSSGTKEKNYMIEIEVDGAYTSGPTLTVKVSCDSGFLSRLLRWIGIK
jgi:hypothetical protein